MDYSTPALPLKLKAVADALCWASGCPVVWKKQSDAPRARENNQRWLELLLIRLSSTGRDEDRYEDDGVIHQIGQRSILLQVNARSRSQDLDQSAWLLAERVKTRVQSRFSKERWLKTNDMSIADVTDVLDTPEGFRHDNRVEDVANFELRLNTFVSETDAANVMHFIETIEVTSDFKNSGEESLDSSLQLDSEVM